jgi:Ser/Thr protein kinase RdoA (MazF antagonist)
VRSAVVQFEVEGELVDLVPYERGHIHDTWISTFEAKGMRTRYLHQRINDHVFTDVPALMHNIERVTAHLARASSTGTGTGPTGTLRLVRSRLGRSFLPTRDGPWRTYHFVEGTQSFDACSGPEQAFEAARAFGEFQARLANLDPSDLRDTIPHFFDPAARLRQLRDALESDPCGRAADAEPELRFVLDRELMTRVIQNDLERAVFPARIVHGDTKLNNVLFDVASGRAACIVDLDTCMPAWSLYDFGDLVRFTAATSAEDERDLDLVGTDLELYAALVAGYLESARAFLQPREIELMPFAARLVTLMIGLRFLTDHLAGDTYFKISRPGQNLDRARVQLRMVKAMEQRAEAMQTR